LSKNNLCQKIKFEQICKNISVRIEDPKLADTDYYIGLEHLDPEEPKILRHGSPQDVSKTKLRFKSGHILFGKRNWYLRRLAIAERSGICSAHMLVLEPMEGKIIKEFLSLLMFSDEFYEKALMVSAGSMSPTIKWKDLAKLEFTIPSISTQETILSIINPIQESISKTQNLLQKIENYYVSKREFLLTRGIEHKKFKKVKEEYGKKTEIPESWKIQKLKDNSIIKGRIGWQGLTTKEYEKEGEFYLVTGTDFKNGRIMWETCVYVNKDRFDQDQKIQLKLNDVLITKDGTIGKIAIIDKLTLPATLNTGVFVIRPIENNYVPEFLFYVFESHHFLKFLDVLKAGSTISHLFQKDFENFSFYVPSKPEQQKIVSILSNLREQSKKLENHLLKLKMLQKSVINSMLTPLEKNNVVN